MRSLKILGFCFIATTAIGCQKSNANAKSFEVRELRIPLSRAHAQLLIAQNDQKELLVGGTDSPLSFVDVTGHLRWQKPLSIHAGQRVFVKDIAPMADGRFLLCGDESSKPDSLPYSYAALLVVVDELGNPSPSTMLRLPSREKGSKIILPRFDKLSRWGKGYAVVGITSFGSNGHPLTPSESEISVVSLDAEARVLWKHDYPYSSETYDIDDVERPIVLSDNSLVIVAHGNNNSFLIRVSADGTLLNTKTLKGKFAIVEPEGPRDFVEIVSAGLEPRELLKFDGELSQLSRTSLPTIGIDPSKSMRIKQGLILIGRGFPPNKDGPLLAFIPDNGDKSLLHAPPLDGENYWFSDGMRTDDAQTIATIHFATHWNRRQSLQPLEAGNGSEEEAVISFIKIKTTNK